eukprot:8719635-Pyramimonas_sp.AAC.2
MGIGEAKMLRSEGGRDKKVGNEGGDGSAQPAPHECAPTKLATELSGGSRVDSRIRERASARPIDDPHPGMILASDVSRASRNPTPSRGTCRRARQVLHSICALPSAERRPHELASSETDAV